MSIKRNSSRLILGLAFAAVLIFSAASMGKSVSAQGNNNNNATASGGETAATITPLQYIANIKQLLGEIQTEYNNGNATQAEELAVQAYLDNFENVEGPLAQAGQRDLMEQLEHMLREELRQKIRDKVSSDELAAFISTINTKLGEAEKAFS
jgi:hypothetical protein